MNLAGSTIRSSDVTMPVLRGYIRSFHMDQRRLERTETPTPGRARRRKPPPEVRDLVGTGRLCVVKGDFEIRAADAGRHAPGNTLRLELEDFNFVICFLADAVTKGGVQRWNFAALFEPTPEQRRWIEALQKPARDPSRAVPPQNAPQPALRKLPPAPVFLKQHRDPQLEFLTELARGEGDQD